MRKRRNTLIPLLQGLLFPAAAVAVLLCFATALDGLDSGRSAEDLKQREQARRRGGGACAAAAGIDPPNREYWEEYSGLQIDETRYTVHYSAFAENLMPDITVLENTL